MQINDESDVEFAAFLDANRSTLPDLPPPTQQDRWQLEDEWQALKATWN